MKSKIENCLYMQVAHCNKCGGQSGYNIIDGEKVCFDCGEPYEADFSVSKVETTITTTNSQDQERYEKRIRIRGELSGETEHIKAHKEYLATSKQDTPEQKEEWEKKWEEFFLYVTNNKNWVDGRPEWKGNVCITLYNAMKDFIRQLLEEREMFTKDELFMLKLATNDIHNKGNSAYDEIGEKIKRELDKLTTK